MRAHAWRSVSKTSARKRPARAGCSPSRSSSPSETLAAANEWIAEKGVRVLNVETVVLPNLGLRESTHEPRMPVITDHVAWYQIIRVWYEVSD